MSVIVSGEPVWYCIAAEHVFVLSLMMSSVIQGLLVTAGADVLYHKAQRPA